MKTFSTPQKSLLINSQLSVQGQKLYSPLKKTLQSLSTLSPMTSTNQNGQSVHYLPSSSTIVPKKQYKINPQQAQYLSYIIYIPKNKRLIQTDNFDKIRNIKFIPINQFVRERNCISESQFGKRVKSMDKNRVEARLYQFEDYGVNEGNHNSNNYRNYINIQYYNNNQDNPQNYVSQFQLQPQTLYMSQRSEKQRSNSLMNTFQAKNIHKNTNINSTQHHNYKIQPNNNIYNHNKANSIHQVYQIDAKNNNKNIRINHNSSPKSNNNVKINNDENGDNGQVQQNQYGLNVVKLGKKKALRKRLLQLQAYIKKSSNYSNNNKNIPHTPEKQLHLQTPIKNDHSNQIHLTNQSYLLCSQKLNQNTSLTTNANTISAKKQTTSNIVYLQQQQAHRLSLLSIDHNSELTDIEKEKIRRQASLNKNYNLFSLLDHAVNYRQARLGKNQIIATKKHYLQK